MDKKDNIKFPDSEILSNNIPDLSCLSTSNPYKGDFITHQADRSIKILKYSTSFSKPFKFRCFDLGLCCFSSHPMITPSEKIRISKLSAKSPFSENQNDPFGRPCTFIRESNSGNCIFRNNNQCNIYADRPRFNSNQDKHTHAEIFSKTPISSIVKPFPYDLATLKSKVSKDLDFEKVSQLQDKLITTISRFDNILIIADYIAIFQSVLIKLYSSDDSEQESATPKDILFITDNLFRMKKHSDTPKYDPAMLKFDSSSKESYISQDQATNNIYRMFSKSDSIIFREYPNNPKQHKVTQSTVHKDISIRIKEISNKRLSEKAKTLFNDYLRYALSRATYQLLILAQLEKRITDSNEYNTIKKKIPIALFFEPLRKHLLAFAFVADSISEKAKHQSGTIENTESHSLATKTLSAKDIIETILMTDNSFLAAPDIYLKQKP